MTKQNNQQVKYKRVYSTANCQPVQMECKRSAASRSMWQSALYAGCMSYLYLLLQQKMGSLRQGYLLWLYYGEIPCIVFTVLSNLIRPLLLQLIRDVTFYHHIVCSMFSRLLTLKQMVT